MLPATQPRNGYNGKKGAGKQLLPNPEQRAHVVSELLRRYLDGEQLVDICREYGLGPVTSYALLYKENEREFSQAQAARSLARFAEALAELDVVKAALLSAQGQSAELEIKRQRELMRLAEIRLKSATWECEKLLRTMYGDTPQISVTLNIGDIGTRIQTLERELGIEGTRLVQATSKAEEKEANDSSD
jgi:hypothetical protein